MSAYAVYLKILEGIREELEPELSRRHGLDCRVGEVFECAVLKLQKKHWSDPEAGGGVFFSVWLGEKDVRKSHFHYNIHALRTRFRKEYVIKPREFATAFRERFRPYAKRWPGVGTDFGPQTLIKGTLPLDTETFRLQVEELMGRFVEVHHLIDELLEERRVR